MLVGFMHRTKKPPLIAKVTSVMSTYYDIDLIYFRPWDIDMENGTVNGKIFKNNKWITVKESLPPLIDATSKSFKKDTREITAYLRENTVLTFDKKNTPNKEKLQKELGKDCKFAHLVIPTELLDSFDKLEAFLDKYSNIILKPLFGKQGLGLYSLKKKDNSYILAYNTEEKELNRDELLEFYQEFLTKEKYILQKLIESRTKNNDPFDCRIVVQKNGTGNWETALIFIRVGNGQKVVSNTSQGGTIITPKQFLKINFGNQWEDIYQSLKDVAMTLPYKIEEIKKTPTMDLGLDIGIDKNGDLFLFEVNNGASKDLIISETSILRLQYYRYLFSTHPELKNWKAKSTKFNNELKGLPELNKRLIQERNRYKKELSQIKNSRSWRVTSPLRKVRSFLK